MLSLVPSGVIERLNTIPFAPAEMFFREDFSDVALPRKTAFINTLT